MQRAIIAARKKRLSEKKAYQSGNNVTARNTVSALVGSICAHFARGKNPLRSLSTTFSFASLLALCVYSQQVGAWVFQEHRELGEASFQEACSFLKREFDNELSPNNSLDQKTRDRLRIESALLSGIACGDPKTQSRLYGARTALSADHIDHPDDYESVAAEQEALSLSNYGKLALGNYQHFWPYAKTTWQAYHEQAVAAAKKARTYWVDGDSNEAKAEFDRALAISAFADHFLEDAFSSGHMGFSRLGSLQSSSLEFHNYFSRRGHLLKSTYIPQSSRSLFLGANERLRLLRSANNDCVTDYTTPYNIDGEVSDPRCSSVQWMAYGDDELDDEAKRQDKNAGSVGGDNRANKFRVIATNRDSIVDVILNFVTDDEEGFSVLADAGFPEAVEFFELDSALSAITQMSSFHLDYARADSYRGNECVAQKGEGLYFENNACWFDLADSYMEPAYPDLTLALTGSQFVGRTGVFPTGYFMYSPWTKKFPNWMKRTRLYLQVSLRNPHDSSRENTNAYTEAGVNVALPALFDRTPFSQEIEVAGATFSHQYLWKQAKRTDQGLYVGLNNNMDMMRFKLSLGIGAFMPNAHVHDFDYKVQVMVAYTKGVIGGGPLSRWKD